MDEMRRAKLGDIALEVEDVERAYNMLIGTQYVDAAGMTIEYRRNHSLEVPPICKHYVKSIYMRKTRSMKLIPFLTEDRARSIHREFGTPKL